METLEKTKKDSIRWTITEEDSLILWRALQVYRGEIDGCHCRAVASENDYDRATKLLAKVIYKSCKFAGTLEGDTEKSIYEDMI